MTKKTRKQATTEVSNPESGGSEFSADESDDADDAQPTGREHAGNPAVHRCIRAWNRAHRKALNDDENSYEAQKAGNRAFVCAMPPLAGYANVRDFVACVTYASMNDVISHRDVLLLLGAAKVALATLSHNPSASGKRERPVGRPAKPVRKTGK